MQTSTKTHLILGGARSGKSRYAESLAIQLAQSSSAHTLNYLATATAEDAEMADRIAHHQARRGNQWRLIESPVDLATHIKHAEADAIVLIDCLTLWLSNCLHHKVWHHEKNAMLDALETSRAHIIMVSNEVGSGIVPLGALSREFVDQSGWLHQTLATLCTDVTLVVAGLPLTLKCQA